METILNFRELETKIKQNFYFRNISIDQLSFNNELIKKENLINCLFTALDFHSVNGFKSINPQNGCHYGFSESSISFEFKKMNEILNIKVSKTDRDLLEKQEIMDCKLFVEI